MEPAHTMAAWLKAGIPPHPVAGPFHANSAIGPRESTGSESVFILYHNMEDDIPTHLGAVWSPGLVGQRGATIPLLLLVAQEAHQPPPDPTLSPPCPPVPQNVDANQLINPRSQGSLKATPPIANHPPAN